MDKTSDVWKRTGPWRCAARRALGVWGLALAGVTSSFAHGVVPGPRFDFWRDTFSFANQLIYIYPRGYAEKRALRPGEKPPAFTLHCFGMCRATEQFRNFARFDPALPRPDAATLGRLVRQVMRHAAWRNPLPPEKRIVLPGYGNLRALSEEQPLLLQKSMGLGWLAYVRPGNYRMLAYAFAGAVAQARVQKDVEDALRRNDLFVGYLTSFPSTSINHAILIYGRRPEARADTAGTVRYLVYDPNHPEAPRDMAYDTRRRMFLFQKDWDFVGGKVTMLQVYNYPVQ